MKAIPMHAIQQLTFALPKCLICMPNDSGCSKIIDRQGNAVGDINWQIPRITIYEEYEYCDEVIQAIGREKFEDIAQEFELPEAADIIRQIEGVHRE